jgi:HSP20 family molecular chaperone IbpA
MRSVGDAITPEPKPIDTTKARAELKNGLLTVVAPVATEAQVKRLDIKAA